MIKKEAVLRRIRELLNKTTENGSEEAEMESALKLAQRLMMQYNIDRDEIELSASDINVLEIENLYEGHETKYWLWDLLEMIAEPYSCKVLKQKKFIPEKFKKIDVYRVIGTKEDRLVVKSIFESILPIARNLRLVRWKAYCKDCKENNRRIMLPATFAKSYFKGFIIGLYQKLIADREEFLINNADKSKWGLIVVKKEDLIEAYINDVEKPNKVNPRQIPLDPLAYRIGEEDGKEKNGNKQLMADNSL